MKYILKIVEENKFNAILSAIKKRTNIKVDGRKITTKNNSFSVELDIDEELLESLPIGLKKHIEIIK